MKIALAVATIGRPYVLYETLEDIARQDRRPDAVCICPASSDDVYIDRNEALDLPISYCRGSKGASAQRNAIIKNLTSPDVVVFIDDDFAMAPDFIAQVERLFSDNQDVVIATGTLIADDVNGRGLLAPEARHLIKISAQPESETITEVYNGYGCNMAVRWAAIEATKARFDENLPLYSWLEDVDFSRQLSGQGNIVRSNLLRGVHRATKHGRTKGVRFGYSQIANQAYLLKKGTVRWKPALWQLLRNVAANARGSVRPEPYIDRRGRLFGNIIAVSDLLLGRLSPNRILEL